MAIHRFLGFVSAYARQNWLYVGLGSYLVFSVLLKSATTIDITLPCLWTSLLGAKCFGCGLTTATVCLVKADIQGAYTHNALIFFILPALGVWVWYDMRLFYKQHTAPKHKALA